MSILGFIKNNIIKPLKEHAMSATISFRIYYPDHPPRTESSTFRATKKHLVEEEHEGCMVCGTHDQLEVHHWFVEWAYSDSVDWDRMKELHPDFDWKNFKGASDFVDSEYNCRVLCMKHHRQKNYGIHMLPFPIWIEQMHDKKGFKFALHKTPSQNQ